MVPNNKPPMLVQQLCSTRESLLNHSNNSIKIIRAKNRTNKSSSTINGTSQSFHFTRAHLLEHVILHFSQSAYGSSINQMAAPKSVQAFNSYSAPAAPVQQRARFVPQEPMISTNTYGSIEGQRPQQQQQQQQRIMSGSSWTSPFTKTVTAESNQQYGQDFNQQQTQSVFRPQQLSSQTVVRSQPAQQYGQNYNQQAPQPILRFQPTQVFSQPAPHTVVRSQPAQQFGQGYNQQASQQNAQAFNQQPQRKYSRCS